MQRLKDLASPVSLALQSLDTTLCKGDFNNIPAITTTMQGVIGIFLNPFPNFFTDPAKTVIPAACAAGTIASIIFSTIYDANRKVGAECVMHNLGFMYTVLCLGWLMHNYLAPAPRHHFPEYMAVCVLTMSCPRRFWLDHLDAVDVGQFAAAGLLNPTQFAGTEIELVVAHLAAVVGAAVMVWYRTEVEVWKTLLKVETQIWAPTVERLEDPTELAQYGLCLTTFKGFLEQEKNTVKKTVGIEA
ncbi:hypothetical protein B0H17DRAFT_1217988 [Mycena rosella]|uniref:Uncharacterized protein n=1 Tax=Mycena rosella TaxID=1033263 RepID=A0AAD7BSR7_MYCRO|nr:hypothetical protein B0H17DRAFT_1217988 [Mycena rosella]